jgi:Gametolysin peptidase M11
MDMTQYRRLVFFFPKNACSWSGAATVGGNPSKSYINGSFSQRVVSHELCHNLGLYHSKALECGAAVTGTSCSAIEYGDTVDVMGSASTGHFNAFKKERLGWLAYGISPPLITVTELGTYPLDVLEPPGAKALKILKSTDPTTGKQTFYYLEYRHALGQDTFLKSNANVINGVVFHLGRWAPPTAAI